jgi:hypothetical protein
VKESTFGQTEDTTKEIGKIICSMEKECIHGLTAEPTKEATSMTKNMALEFTNGQMGEFTQVNGKTAKIMVKVFLQTLRERQERAFGKMGKDLNGWANPHQNQIIQRAKKAQLKNHHNHLKNLTE